MLRTLSIRDVVLIDRLELSFRPGLGVLTGETGAGKSILLDALGLALGARADSGLVRHGAAQAAVAAEFDLKSTHPALALLAEHGLDGADGELLVRRVVGRDGRSRAFVNDQPVSVTLLKSLGETLVDVHGQFESRRLVDPAIHRILLDAHGTLAAQVAEVGNRFRAWREATATRIRAAAELEKARREEEFLRHAVDELTAFAPKAGDEVELAGKRAVMMHGEKLLDAMNQAAEDLAEGRGVETALRSAVRHLERVAEKAEGRLEPAIAALDRAAVEVAEGLARLDRAGADIDLDPRHLERVEERLFALRALARKHNVDADDLPALAERMAARLAAVEDGGAAVARLEREEVAARAEYVEAAADLSRARADAASRLDTAVATELEPLKLGQATFATRVVALDESAWGENGADRVAFEVSTNPGTPPGPLARISSGGELARFMLALKVVLAHADPVPTIVFDEVDSDVGGAVAAAVGERLARLGDAFQVLVITHSPQVAARGAHHWRVAKSEARTTVDALVPAARREEIARMLAGEHITDEARAAADSLLGDAPT
jgi:DNA repair protein RecN (Recombination protein N)